MSRWRDGRTRASAVVLTAVVATACGGTGTKTDPVVTSATTVATTVATTSTTVAPVVTTTTPLPSPAQDAAAAQKVLLRAGDLPGYTGGSSSPASPYATVYSQCTGNPAMPEGKTGRSAAQAPFLLDETATLRAVQTTAVSSFAVFTESDTAARRAVADLVKPDVASCVGKALLTELNRLTSSPGSAASQTTAALPALGAGDESAGLRTTITGTTAVLQYFDLTVVRKGRRLAYLFVSRLAKTPLSEDDRRRLVSLLASRMG